MIVLNLLDYILIVILGLSIIIGLKQGFIKAITSFASTIIALILAILFHNITLSYLNLYFNIGDYLTQTIYQLWATPYFVTEPSLFTYIFPLEDYFIDIRDKLIYIGQVIISFLAVFAISRMGLKFIFAFLARIFSWGILSWFNRILGMVFITLKNLLLFLLTLSLLSPIIELLSQMGLVTALVVYNIIINSAIANYLLFLMQTILL